MSQTKEVDESLIFKVLRAGIDKYQYKELIWRVRVTVFRINSLQIQFTPRTNLFLLIGELARSRCHSSNQRLTKMLICATTF